MNEGSNIKSNGDVIELLKEMIEERCIYDAEWGVISSSNGFLINYVGKIKDVYFQLNSVINIYFEHTKLIIDLKEIEVKFDDDEKEFIFENDNQVLLLSMM